MREGWRHDDVIRDDPEGYDAAWTAFAETHGMARAALLARPGVSPDRRPEITRLYVEMVGEVWLLTITSCEPVAEVQAFHHLFAEVDAAFPTAARRVLSKLTAAAADFLEQNQRTSQDRGFDALLNVNSDVANVAKTIKHGCGALMELHPRLRAWPSRPRVNVRPHGSIRVGQRRPASFDLFVLRSLNHGVSSLTSRSCYVGSAMEVDGGAG